VLSYSQLRTGPTKVSLIGMLIPLVDFVKLRLKRSIVRMNNVIMYSICTKIAISLLLLRFCKYYNFIANNYIIFYLILVRRVIGYAILIPGLSTKRLYRVLGMVRIFIIILRFEIRLFLLVITLSYLNLRRRIYLTLLVLPIMSVLCIFIFTMEINRHPFEVIEGESELVSGYNVELSSLIFMVFFLREIINIRIIVVIVRLIYNILFIYLPIILLVLMMRRRFPRIRYDVVMLFQWTVIYFMCITIFYLC